MFCLFCHVSFLFVLSLLLPLAYTVNKYHVCLNDALIARASERRGWRMELVGNGRLSM